MHGRHLALTNKQKSSWQVAVVVLASKPCKQPDSKMETVTVRLFGFAGEWEFALFESYCKIGNFPEISSREMSMLIKWLLYLLSYIKA